VSSRGTDQDFTDTDPSLTNMANALRIADHIESRWKSLAG